MMCFDTQPPTFLFFLPRAKDELTPKPLLLSPSPPLLSPLSSPLFFVNMPHNTARGLGERCKLSQWGLGQSPADKRFGAYWSQKVQLWWQQFFVDFFAKNKCNFLHMHKNTLDIVRRVQLLIRRRPMRSFSPGAVATIALWKSAPMVERLVSLKYRSLFWTCSDSDVF